MFCLNLAIRESFSAPHDIGYSIEAVQEANLATRFNPLFWECACLSINAGISAIDTITDLTQEDNDEEDTLPPEEDNIKNNKSITPNYVKISNLGRHFLSAINFFSCTEVNLSLLGCSSSAIEFK